MGKSCFNVELSVLILSRGTESASVGVEKWSEMSSATREDKTRAKYKIDSTCDWYELGIFLPLEPTVGMIL